MRDLRNGIHIRDVAVGVAQRFQINGPAFRTDGRLQFRQIVRVHKGCPDPVVGQGMGKQIVAAPIDRFLRHNMSPILCKRLQCVGNSRRAGSQRQRRHPSLQCSQAFLQYILGGIGQPSVYVPRIRKTKPCRRMGTVPEYVRSRLINRHGPGIRGRIRLFLSHMQL